MEKGLYHITSATETVLIPIFGNMGLIKSISICNNHVSVAADIDLYLVDSSSDDSYILKEMKIPPGATLLLDHDISFDNSVLGLHILTTGTGLPISVIIK